jgi:hypothetical protein
MFEDSGPKTSTREFAKIERELVAEAAEQSAHPAEFLQESKEEKVKDESEALTNGSRSARHVLNERGTRALSTLSANAGRLRRRLRHSIRPVGLFLGLGALLYGTLYWISTDPPGWWATSKSASPDPPPLEPGRPYLLHRITTTRDQLGTVQSADARDESGRVVASLRVVKTENKLLVVEERQFDRKGEVAYRGVLYFDEAGDAVRDEAVSGHKLFDIFDAWPPDRYLPPPH